MPGEKFTKIINGHPVEMQLCGGTDEAEVICDEKFSDIPKDSRKRCTEWVRSHVVSAKTIAEDISSYGLKHILYADIGIYMSNNQFKDMMKSLGFKAKDESELNWVFYIRKVIPDYLEKEYLKKYGTHTRAYKFIHER